MDEITNLEMMIIGALFIGGEKDLVVQEAILKLEVCHFFNYIAQEVFEQIKSRCLLRQPFDVGIVMSCVSNEAIDYCASSATCVFSTSSLLSYVESLITRYHRNQAENLLKSSLKEIEQEKIDTVACDKISSLGIQLAKSGAKHDKFSWEGDELGDIIVSDDHKNEFKVPTGVFSIDSMITEGGIRNRSMVTIAGRSSMGKTSFAMFFAHNLAKNHPAKRLVVYSLEMTHRDIAEKQVGVSCGKKFDRMTRVDKAMGWIKAQSEASIVVYDKPLASIDYICTTARIESAKKPIGVIVVDYIGIVSNPKSTESMALRMADVSAQLAGLAKELNCIVIALSQVNREYANRVDKRPLMSDAADSSGSERNSDMWLGIYRPSFDDPSPHLKNNFLVTCRKDRFGTPWEACLKFEDSIFSEYPRQSWEYDKSTIS